MTEQENKIFELIKSNPNLSISDIIKILSLPKSAVNRSMRELKQKGYIMRRSLDKSNGWIILK